MSRVTKPPPYGHHLLDLSDAYQMCARCGEILAAGETVQVVYRGDRGTWRGYIYPAGPDWWGVYTHLEGPDCPPGAASGWLAVRRAIEMRGPDNPAIAEMEGLGKRKGREAQPIILQGFVFPFVSLLDRKHCEVEKMAVTIGRHEILESDRTSVQSMRDGREPDKEDDVGRYKYNVKKAASRHDYVEDAYIRALDAGELLLGKRAELIRDITAREQANLHVSACAVRGTNGAFEFFYPGEVTTKGLDYEMRAPEESKKTILKGVTHGQVLTLDVAGRPVEYALYSRMPVTHGEHGDKKFWLEGKTLDEFRFHRFSCPKPRPVLLELDSRRFPELYEWFDPPSDLVEHWPRNPRSPRAGRPARLKQSALRVL